MVFGKPVGHGSTVQSKPHSAGGRHYHRTHCQCGFVGPWRVYLDTARSDAAEHLNIVTAGMGPVRVDVSSQ
jgi:hypothetical protein